MMFAILAIATSTSTSTTTAGRGESGVVVPQSPHKGFSK
jgi:hypothetical protein